MPPTDDAYLLPEQRARKRIDETLVRAGWVVQDYKSINLYASAGVAVRELVTTAVDDLEAAEALRGTGAEVEE